MSKCGIILLEGFLIEPTTDKLLGVEASFLLLNKTHDNTGDQRLFMEGKYIYHQV
jgi:hypothetical protein